MFLDLPLKLCAHCLTICLFLMCKCALDLFACCLLCIWICLRSIKHSFTDWCHKTMEEIITESLCWYLTLLNHILDAPTTYNGFKFPSDGFTLHGHLVQTKLRVGENVLDKMYVLIRIIYPFRTDDSDTAASVIIVRITLCPFLL